MTPTTRQTSWQRLRAELQPALLAGVPEHLQRLAWSAEQIHAAQQNGLRRLLAHAVTHAPFHRRRLAGIDVDRLEPADLSSLPVMTKADMMAALEEVLTDQRLTRNLVEQALAATAAEPVPILDDYVALATGGSSGQRGVHVFDRAALVGYASSLARPLLARLHALGGPPPGGLPIAMVAAVSVPAGPGHLAAAPDRGAAEHVAGAHRVRVLLDAGSPGGRTARRPPAHRAAGGDRDGRDAAARDPRGDQ